MFYLTKLPAQKVEIIDEVSEFLGCQNLNTPEINWEIFTETFINLAKNNNKFLVCVLDNSSFDAAAVLETDYDIQRFCNVERDADYRPHYYFLVDKQFINEWK